MSGATCFHFLLKLPLNGAEAAPELTRTRYSVAKAANRSDVGKQSISEGKWGVGIHIFETQATEDRAKKPELKVESAFGSF